MVKERLELDLGSALASLNKLDEAFRRASVDFSQAVNKAVSQVSSVAVKADTKLVTPAIDKAVDAADTTVELNVDSTPIVTANERVRDAHGRFIKLGETVDDTNKKIPKTKEHAEGVRDALGEARDAAAKLGVVLGAIQVVKFFAQSVQAASDLNETLSKSQAVFHAASGFVGQFASTAAKSFGLSERAALEAAGTVGNLLTSLGVGRTAAAGMSVEVTKLAADLGSFNNIGIEDALTALRSGLVGEIEPLRRLGVSFNAMQVEAKAAELGLVGANGVVSEGAKVQARYALILEQSKNAQGDFAKTSDGLANTTKILQAQFADLQVEIGRELLPSVLDFAHTASRDLLPALGEFLVQGGRLANQVLPLLGANTQAVTGLLSLFADVLAALPDELLQATLLGAGFARMLGDDASRGAKSAALAVGALIPLLGMLDKEAANVATSMATFAALGFRVAGPWGAAIGAIVGAAGALSGMDEVAGLTAETISKLGTLSDKTLRDLARGLAGLRGTGFFSAQDALNNLRTAAEQNVVTGKRFGDALVDAGVVKAGQVERVLRDVAKGQQQLKADTDAASTAIEDQGLSYDDAKASYDAYISKLSGGLPTILSVFDEAAKGIEDFSKAGSPEKLLENLQKQLEGISTFGTNVQSLMDRGLTNVAALVASKGPIAGAQLAQALAGAEPAVAAGIEKALTAVPGALDGVRALIDRNGPAWAKSAFGAASGMSPEILRALGLIPAEIAPQVSIFGKTIGADMFGGMKAGIESQQSALEAAAAEVAFAAVKSARSALGIFSPSKVMAEVGEQTMEGFAVGMERSALRPAAVAASAAAAVPQAAAAVAQTPGPLVGSMTITAHDPDQAARRFSRELSFQRRFAGV